MKHAKLRFGKGFRVVFGNRRSQMAEMVLEPGDSEGNPGNRHKRADQWLYVVGGTGTAIVNGRKVRLARGVLLLIEHQDRHEIKNTGRSHLRTLNWYSPPAYTKSGNELPAARSR
jgi:mannose-6-phosphate isomerase-like protein (cupin superfamily)